MKRIGLFLGAEPSHGGMFQYNQAMLEAVGALQSDRYSIVVAYTSKQWTDYLETRRYDTLFIQKGFWERALWWLWRTPHLPVNVWRAICPFFHPVAKTLLKEHCDLWIFPTQDPYGLQIPVPALAAIHDLMHRYESRFPEVSAKGMYRMREWTSRNICVWAKGILVDSAVGKHHVMESYGLSAERIHILPYVAPKYMHVQNKSNDFNVKYRLPDKFIFYPAQFWEHKNHKRLISAVSRLKQQLPDLKLVLVGMANNGYASTLQHIQNLQLLDDVIILGYVPNTDIPELYRRARALIMPTFFGPTNIPPLEAFAAGCPVAISNIYGIPEQLGDAALYFDPSSVNDIARAIRVLWTDDELCSSLVRKGSQKHAAWGQKEFNERLQSIIEVMLMTH
jgi:glycosyltransferase involved in cell wall biosynthesis